jgi:hypothetical protein
MVMSGGDENRAQKNLKSDSFLLCSHLLLTWTSKGWREKTLDLLLQFWYEDLSKCLIVYNSKCGSVGG